MKELKFYKYATIGLLILNIGLITFFFLTKPKGPHPRLGNEFRPNVVELLDLSEDQNTLFLNSAKAHNEKMMSISKNQKDLLKPYFKSLSSQSNRIIADSILSKVQSFEKDKVLVTYEHLQEIKSMLNLNQMDNYEKFIGNFLERNKFENRPPKK